MSMFKTTIPVDLASVRQALPPQSYVHSTKLNEATSEVEVVWESDAFTTPYTFPLPMTLDELAARMAAQPVASEVEVPLAKPVEKVKRGRRKKVS